MLAVGGQMVYSEVLKVRQWWRVVQACHLPCIYGTLRIVLIFYFYIQSDISKIAI